MNSFQNALPPGHLIGAWRIDRVVATSASGVVYAATDTTRGTVLALKEYMPVQWARRDETGSVLPTDAAAFERGLNAFVSSAQLLARCRHAALVPVLGVGEVNGTAYQAMPWIAATPLSDLRAAMPGPPDETALRALLDNLLDALATVHAAGSIHGGVEPAKVLLQRDDQAVLLGPGDAAREGEPGAFIAPEQSGQGGGDGPGPWTDLYALAAVARFCIAGDGAPADVPTGVPLAGYSASLLATIERALSPRVADRPQSVAAFREGLAGPAPAPVASGIVLDAERARIKRVVDSINFDEGAAEPPRTDGLGRRPRPTRVAAAVPPAPSARPPRWRAAAIGGAVVLAALGAWALLRAPEVGPAPRPAPPRVAASAAPASAPASAAKPSVEESLAMAAAVLAAASGGPASPAPAPAPAEVAPAPVVAAPAPVVVAPAASESTKPRPVVKRAVATPPAKRPPVATPRAACVGRSDFALYRCMTTQCAQTRWAAHPQCVRLRQTDRVDG